ncbi:MAG: TRAP transporter small permease, partial [Desulfobacterales bacterium]|nr:TRAP transporter small permease [Desulfobacterales bacterium]
MDIANGVEKRIHPVAKYVNAAGAFTSLIMVLLVTAHVLSRALFSKPLIGMVEIEELMIVILVFCGIAYTQITGNHISVDFVTIRLPKQIKNLISITTSLLTSLFLFILSWQSLVQSKNQMVNGTATFDLQIKLYWVMWIVAVGFFLFGLSTFISFFKITHETITSGRFISTAIAVFAALVLVAVPFMGFELDIEIGQYFGIIALLLFLFSGMLIGAALGFLGFFGMALLFGPESGLGLLKTVP